MIWYLMIMNKEKNIQISNKIKLKNGVKVRIKNINEKVKDLDLHQNKIKNILNVAEAEAIRDINVEIDHDLIIDQILIKNTKIIIKNNHQDRILNQNNIKKIVNSNKIKIIILLNMIIEKKNDINEFFISFFFFFN